jgi:hypothetical protein
MDTWVQKAEHAFRTGQPRMAELYMRRGLSESPHGRAWLARYDFGQAMTEAGRELTRIYRETFAPIVDVLAGFTIIPDPAMGRDQFALVAPPEARP